MSQRAEPDPAAELYHGTSGREYHDGKRALNPQALPWVMALRAEKLQPHVSARDTVLEFGAGSGWNLGKLRCARRLGCDTAAFLRDRIEAAGAEYVESMAVVPPASVDVVICHQTLEHVLEPAACLSEFRRVLKLGGRLIVHVPWERERRYRGYHPQEPNHHLYSWNAQTLGNLLTVTGFSVQSVMVRAYGYDRFAANLACRWGLGESGFRLLRNTMILIRPLLEIEALARNERKAEKVEKVEKGVVEAGRGS